MEPPISKEDFCQALDSLCQKARSYNAETQDLDLFIKSFKEHIGEVIKLALSLDGDFAGNVIYNLTKVIESLDELEKNKAYVSDHLKSVQSRLRPQQFANHPVSSGRCY